MEAPSEIRSTADEREEITITRRRYEDETVIAIDFGADVEASVDVVGDTAIIVAGDDQFEFAVPPEATEVSANGGILLIRD